MQHIYGENCTNNTFSHSTTYVLRGVCLRVYIKTDFRFHSISLIYRTARPHPKWVCLRVRYFERTKCVKPWFLGFLCVCVCLWHFSPRLNPFVYINAVCVRATAAPPAQHASKCSCLFVCVCVMHTLC